MEVARRYLGRCSPNGKSPSNGRQAGPALPDWFVEPGCHGQTCLSVWCYRQRSNARQTKRTFEFNRAFPWPNSRTPSNLFVRAVLSQKIKHPQDQTNFVGQTGLVALATARANNLSRRPISSATLPIESLLLPRIQVGTKPAGCYQTMVADQSSARLKSVENLA
jgi:hypothetical protein